MDECIQSHDGMAFVSYSYLPGSIDIQQDECVGRCQLLRQFIRRQVGHLRWPHFTRDGKPGTFLAAFHDGIDQVSLFQHPRPPDAGCAKLCA